MIKYIVISDKQTDFLSPAPDMEVISATDFISNHACVDLRKSRSTKIINLCSDFDYLSKGYYCSLLAQARGMRCVPDVSNILTLNWKRLYQTHLPELNMLLENDYKNIDDEPSSKTYVICFGRCRESSLETLGRRIFDLFRFPLMSIEIKLDSKNHWSISSVEPLSISDLPRQKYDFFNESLKKFTGSAWRTQEGTKYKNWIAILHDPAEKQPPSNKAALKKFIKVGKDMNIAVELITKNDLASIPEYDGLLIRETTAINNHTFRFAHKAETESIPVIDDTTSIIRCSNKVFQYEILESKKIPLPKTHIFDKKRVKDISIEVSYPAVIKIPDGSFSRGVVKVESPESFIAAATELLKKSEIILVQEFVASDFDWRIGILNNTPLYACKYYMAQGHWQIYNHNAKSLKRKEGNSETLPIENVPETVLSTALKAAKLMGDGFYGVDLKQIGSRAIIIEINDNPNIDAGIEDLVLGDKLYAAILQELVNRINS